MKLSKQILLLGCSLFASVTAFGQMMADPDFTKEEKEKGYYLFPVQPGQRNYLAGTMGELRPSHFHGGLDIKTGGTVGYKIHATAQGYISRIKISEGGYGNALYMAHPNGTTSVYAHLDRFEGKLAEWVRQQQYKQKSFEIELFPEPGQFAYDQGQVIAYGGNSGSSGGPHLHFEIRDAKQDVLNPLSYGFDEILDTTSPLVYKMAVKSMDAQSRVNHQFGRFEIKPTYLGGDYVIDKPIEVWGNVGLELLSYDKLDGANNNNGFPCIEMYANDQEHFAHKLDKFSFSTTRHIEVHMDYATRKRTGSKFIRLYKADGNELEFYKHGASEGTINISTPDSVVDVRLQLADTYGNMRTVKLKLIGKEPKQEISSEFAPLDKLREPEVQENTLKFYAPLRDNISPIAKLYANRTTVDLNPAYQLNKHAVYLWDLRNGLPDSVDACNEVQTFNFSASVPAGQEFNLFLPEYSLHFPQNTLFDTLYLETRVLEKNGEKVYHIGEDVQPLKRSFEVRLSPKDSFPQRDRVQAYQRYGRNSYGWEGGHWVGDNFIFRTRELGDYVLLADTIAPEIRPIRINSSSLSFRIHDALSGISSYEVKVNGEWVLMAYDYKRKTIWSEKLNESIPFKGLVEVRVTDQAGNIQTYTTKI